MGRCRKTLRQQDGNDADSVATEFMMTTVSSQQIPTPIKKTKILMISDHPLCFSGVGTQARFLIHGLLNTGRYSFRCLGGAVSHPNHDPIVVNPDFIIKPVDGFGNHDIIRNILLTEQPDAVLLFTDPRQFMWFWEIEDEVHQFCPITYWHVWDNDPYPAFNDVWYRSTDLINCLSRKTYDLVHPRFPDKTNYIPHTFPSEVAFKLPQTEIDSLRKAHFGDRAKWFTGLWVNRNATRKMPNDVLHGWKLFLDNLQQAKGHRDAMLIMHTNPTDSEGPNLFATAEMLGISDRVLFSTKHVDFVDLNALYNCVDFSVNVSKAEGFGLNVLNSLMVGKPVIALKTGGLTRQVVDYRTGQELGVAIEPAARTMVGSQMVPYIFDDHVNVNDLAAAYMKLFEMPQEDKDKLSTAMADYMAHEFDYKTMVATWDQTLQRCVDTWRLNGNKASPRTWTVTSLTNDTSQQPHNHQ